MNIGKCEYCNTNQKLGNISNPFEFPPRAENLCMPCAIVYKKSWKDNDEEKYNEIANKIYANLS